MSNQEEHEFSVRELKTTQAERSADMGNLQKSKKKPSVFRPRNIFLVIVLAVLIGGGYFFYQTSSAFDKMTGKSNSLIKSIAKMLPLGDNIFQILPVEKSDSSAIDDYNKDKLDRLNFLLLGYRGVDDPNGGLLTDSIMVVSIKKSTGEVALISVPRDLYVTLPHSENKGKINEAYALGTKNGGWQDALAYSKQEVEDVTGLNINYVASIDFTAFKEIIDTLGGITIYLDQPFVEKVPFAEGPISLPAGSNTLSGEKALLYSRARESSSDFDRVRRQQQVLLAIKSKALSLGVITNPAKIVSIVNSLGNHVRTDAELWEMEDLAVVFSKIDNAKIKHRIFDTSENGLLYQSHAPNGAYILLPEGGNYDKIRAACKNIFDADTTNAISSKAGD
jgi:LCP family protein required for cell wall assembly